MKTKFLLVLVSIFCTTSMSSIFSGCGTLFRGTTQSIQVNATPYGAIVGVDRRQYTTPVTIKLKRRRSYLLTISKEGYETEKRVINRKISGKIVVLDIIFSGLLGLIVDGVTGAWYNLEPNNINVYLRSQNTGLLDIPVNVLKAKNGVIEIKSSEPIKIALEVIDPNTE